jgi:hypothetical protein
MANESVVDIDAMTPVIAVHAGSMGALEQALRNREADVLRLDGTTIVDKESLLAGVAADLAPAADAEDMRPRGWDGLNDLLWQVLAARPTDRVALIWTHADVLMERSLNDFLSGLNVFGDVSRAVRSTGNGFPRVMQFQVFVLGDAPSFPQLRGS